jgi:hypothetical protein
MFCLQELGLGVLGTWPIGSSVSTIALIPNVMAKLISTTIELQHNSKI